MPLAAGDKLGVYEIVAPIGRGGMGEVYRARDPRMGREVAIKTSAERFTERFDREVRAIASLNHPNVCTLHDVGPNYLVMELVEGPTLAERIREGPLPLDEALAIARQIAAGLEAAHEKGITHRDLKPGNVKVKPDGTVKVLDFGLAKVGPRMASGSNPEDSPTLSMAATQAGVILGTAAYMSPEQARGKPVDKRADIWAFGVVLYEMVTGKKLFAGEDLADTLATVVKVEPDLSAAPLELQRLLKRCLEKDPRKRLRDIGDAWDLLDERGASPPAAAIPTKRLSHWSGWAVAGLLAASTVIGFWAPWRAEPERPLTRLVVDLGSDVALVANSAQQVVVLSPDGTRLAYSVLAPQSARVNVLQQSLPSIAGGSVNRDFAAAANRLFVRRLDQSNPVELVAARGASNLFFSPDSKWIGFFAGGMLQKISVEGGAAVPIVEVVDSRGGDWSEDGTILFGGSTGLWRIAPGGKPEQLTKTEDTGRAHLYPRFLPGGKAALFFSIAGVPNVVSTVIEAVTLADGKRKEVLRGGVSPHYLPSGHLIYMSNGALFAIGFDPEKLETRGTAVPILDDVQFNANTGTANLSFSRNGTLVHREGKEESYNLFAPPLATLDWIDASGKRSALISEPGHFIRPRVSPDGGQLAVLIQDADSRDYWVYDLRRDSRHKITFGGMAVSTVAWGADSRHIFFGSGSGGNAGSLGIFWTTADGAGQPRRLLETKGGVEFVTSYSETAKRLAYFGIRGNMFTLPVAFESEEWKTTGQPEPFFPTDFAEQSPVFSPDGRWIAYSSDESGQPEVYVRAFQPGSSGGPGGKWTISTSGGTAPHWSRNRSELLYQEGDRVLAVPYTVRADTFEPGKPVVRADKLGTGPENWDLAPDGRIAVVARIESASEVTPPAEHTVVFLENFFDELKRRVK